REARDRPLLLREPDAPRDRGGPGGDRVARVADAHQGRPSAALADAGGVLRELIPEPWRDRRPGGMVRGPKGKRRITWQRSVSGPQRTAFATSPSSATAA